MRKRESRPQPQRQEYFRGYHGDRSVIEEILRRFPGYYNLELAERVKIYDFMRIEKGVN